MKPPRKYASATAFRVALESRLKKMAQEEGLDLQRLRRQAAFDRLLCRLFAEPDAPWLLKGGYAMELRLKTARTTRDIDLAMRRLPVASADWDANVSGVLESLREAGNLDLHDSFTFVFGNATQDLDAAPYGGARFPVDAWLAGRTFAKFHLDVSTGDVLREPYETLSGRDWLRFAGIPSANFPAVSPEEQFAEKLHAYTLPRMGRENTRVKDLVDLVLLIERTKLDAVRLPMAIHETFQRRKTHGIPPALIPPPASWFDVGAFLHTCAEWKVPTVLERSRSGRGGHIWIFFETPLPARLVRKLGAAILTRTMEQRHQLGLDSYDRLFPSQDTMPKGGFGNLIAFPLQHMPRGHGNSVFLDADFNPHPDQWALLSCVRRMVFTEVENIVRDAERSGDLIGVRRSVTDDEQTEDPWTLPPSRKKKDETISGPLPAKVRVVRGNLVFVETEGLPSAMLNRLHRLAAFQNPEFYRAQAMRLSTYGKPRVLRCAEEFPRHVALPRGCLGEIMALLESHKIAVELDDQRFAGQPIDVTFHGQLRPDQQAAANAMLSFDDGILSATTAFGKTVVAAWLIAARKVNTLVLVHRRQLLDQWRERLATFLNLPLKSIGQIGGGRRRPSGLVDVAVIQSLNRKQVVDDVVANYGHVIVDECHHISAVSFEQVLRQVKARYITGLTATPQRKDGHHPIIVMQCGPIRHRVNAKEQALARPFKHIVIPRPTNFRLPPSTEKPEMHELYAALANNKARNDLIYVDMLRVIKAGRSPILLTERTSQVDEFASRLTGLVNHIVVLKGGMGAKQRRVIAEQLTTIPDGEERVLLATGRYIGEGFDDARLDTLFLAMPISWRGTLQQYVGRLHRLYDSKREVIVYDYVDGCVPVLSAMYSKRVRGYEAVGYVIQDE